MVLSVSLQIVFCIRLTQDANCVCSQALEPIRGWCLGIGFLHDDAIHWQLRNLFPGQRFAEVFVLWGYLENAENTNVCDANPKQRCEFIVLVFWGEILIESLEIPGS